MDQTVISSDSRPVPIIMQRIIDNSVYERCIEEGFSEPLSRVIAGREIYSGTSSVRKAIMPTLTDIESPDSLADIDKAVDRLIAAKNNDEILNLCIDFDADGQTSLSVLYRGLLLLGFKKECLTYMSAHRLIEGYGLNEKMVARILAQKPRCSLILTADNGSSDSDTISLLADSGIDVIVTDHHALTDGPPEKAIAVVNPVRKDCAFPDKSIAGVSVAFMLLIALRKKLIEKQQVDPKVSVASLLTFCGLGVQADCVHLGKSLTNRAMVRYALFNMQKTDTYVCWQALRKLGKHEDQRIDSEFLSYTVAPAINAAGRLDTSKLASALFLTDDLEEAESLVSDLYHFNERRKKIERTMAKEAKAIAQKEHALGRYGLVCFLPSGNPGVVGIVGGRVTSAFGKPSLILAPMADNPDILTGSMRSPESYSIKDGIAWIKKQHKNLLIKGGGHDRAGGLSIHKENLATLSEIFENSCREQITDGFILRPIIETDGVLDPEHLNLKLVHEISTIQPFGQGFPSPVFEAEGTLIAFRSVGTPAVHAQVQIKIGNQLVKGIWFFYKDDPEDDALLIVNNKYRWFFSLSENRFRGTSSVQLIINFCELCSILK